MNHTKTVILSLLVVLSIKVLAVDGTNEYQLKAAYLERFCRFIEWEARKDSEDIFRIAIVGNIHSQSHFIEFFNKNKIQGISVMVYQYESNRLSKPPHIIYYESAPDSTLYAQISEDLKAYPTILTIGNDLEMLSHHPIITFNLVDNYLTFLIDHSEVEKSTLSISSFLLEMAQSVDRKD